MEPTSADDTLRHPRSPAEEDRLLYRQVREVKAGQIHRFKIKYSPPPSTDGSPPSDIWVKIKNKELIALRAAYLAGPYVLYVDCRPEEFNPNKQCFVTADQPVFEPQLLPGQSFYTELSCHTIKEEYCWIVDVVSQTIFNNTIDIDFEITIGTSKGILHQASFPDKKVTNSDKIGVFGPSTVLSVANQDTFDLWNLPIPDPEKPIHLVIVTHGLHSNVGTDMLYLKEEIDKAGAYDNIVVKGFFGNVCKTERGVKYLGSRVAEFIIDLVTKNETFNEDKLLKISFVGHSLGGLVQTFAIAYLQSNFPWFFEKYTPVNFINIASPMLGVVTENPLYVKIALLAGIVGKTGQDLGLKYIEDNDKPLLLLLPTGPTHQALKKFARRTVYANVINDGIVPLRTSALLFLDYKGLSQIINSDDIIYENGNTKKIPSKQYVNEQAGYESTVSQTVQTFLSFFMPQKQKKQAPEGLLKRYQTATELNSEFEQEIYGEIPRSSVLETAACLILPPLPSMKFITNPDCRENVVIHDKVYSEDDLPSQSEHITGLASKKEVEDKHGESIKQRLLNTLEYNKDVDTIEEDIAREYHKNMTWRKVLIKLKPDAHNNIIVRRRFANAYGWPVIDHLVRNHFGKDADKVEGSVEPESLASTDSLDEGTDLTSILSRELISRQNEAIEEEVRDDQAHAWINSKDNSDSIFAVGPTGLLSDVSELIGNLRDQWYNFNAVPGPQLEEGEATRNPAVEEDAMEVNDTSLEETGLGLQKEVMGGFV